MARRLEVHNLEPGLVVARDVFASERLLLVPKGGVLTKEKIGQLVKRRVREVWVEEAKPQETAAEPVAEAPEESKKPVDGSFELTAKKYSTRLTVKPPEEGGKPVTLELVKKELEERKLVRIDWSRCEEVVTRAEGVPANIGIRDGLFFMEVSEEGLFLTVLRPLPGGKKVTFAQVGEALEADGRHVTDERQVERLVATAAGERTKVGEADGAVQVRVAADRLSAELLVLGPNGGRPADVESANRALQHEGVVHGLDSDAVEEALRPENWGKPVVVAQREPPEDGTDAQLLERFHESKTLLSLIEQGAGTVECKILEPAVVVREGEVLVEKLLSVPGKEGVDVTGKPLAAPPVRDATLPQAGEHVETSPDGLKLIATQQGVPRSTGQQVSIEPVKRLRLEALELEVALDVGCRILAIPRESAAHRVEQEGRKGVLGIGAVPFRVQVFHKSVSEKKAPEPAVEGPEEPPEPADGTFAIMAKKDSIMLMVKPPKGEGKPVTMEQVKEELERQKLVRIDWSRCEQVVKGAQGLPANIGKREGMFLVEVAEDGLFLTVLAPLSGGKKVTFFEVRKLLEADGRNVSDQRLVQRLVATPTARRTKIGEADGTVQVKVAAKRLSAELIVAGPNGGSPVDEEVARRALQHDGVVHGIDSGAIEEALRPGNWGKPIVVARGEPAVDGTDAKILESYKESPTLRSLIEQGTEKVECQILEPPVVVKEGEVLVEKVPSVPGKDGVDVTGKPRRPRMVRDLKLPQAGAHVESSPDGLKLTAMQAGVPRSTRRRLSIEPVAEVRLEAPELETALDAACRILGIPRDSAAHEVEQKGRKGVLGLGAVPFRVRVFRKGESTESNRT